MRNQESNLIAVPCGNDITNPIRNTSQLYLKFLNSSVFSEDGRRFLKYGYYTDAPKGTLDFKRYWDEQEKRCLFGYTVGGVRITGRNYFYLNFCPIKARPLNPLTGLEDINARKRWTLPRFLDHNYYLFNELEECMAEGIYTNNERQGLIMLKSRRKGITYQLSGGVYAYNFVFLPHSMNMLAAYEKAHYKVTLDAIHSVINHINKHTPWIRRREVLNQRERFRASFKEVVDGVEVEDGYMSEIHAISFKDNPFKSIGDSLDIAGFEEAGKFDGLLEALALTEPTYRDGDIMTGVPLVWGTGGDVEIGSLALAEFFYNPKAYGFKSYNNIYDENATGDCGWFIDDLWYLPGISHMGGKPVYMVDSQGNSIREAARENLMQKRGVKKKGDPRSYKTFITQQPLTPKEALMRADGDFFDSIAAQDRLSQIETNPKIYINTIHVGKLIIDDNGEVHWRPSDEVMPVREFPIRDNKDKAGAIEIFEHPVHNDKGEIPSGMYIAGIDPYDDDESTTNSLGCTFIMNMLTDRIVAEYTGRPQTAYQYYENVRRLLLYYNATAMYENAKKGLFTYFDRMNCTYLLADTPKFLKDVELVKTVSSGNSAKGYFPSTQVNTFGRGLIRNWSMLPAQGHNDNVTNMQVIRSIGLLKELINFNPKGNFDRVSAMIALMLYREEVGRYVTSDIINTKVELKREDKFFCRGYGSYDKNLFGFRN